MSVKQPEMEAHAACGVILAALKKEGQGHLDPASDMWGDEDEEPTPSSTPSPDCYDLFILVWLYLNQ